MSPIEKYSLIGRAITTNNNINYYNNHNLIIKLVCENGSKLIEKKYNVCCFYSQESNTSSCKIIDLNSATKEIELIGTVNDKECCLYVKGGIINQPIKVYVEENENINFWQFLDYSSALTSLPFEQIKPSIDQTNDIKISEVGVIPVTCNASAETTKTISFKKTYDNPPFVIITVKRNGYSNTTRWQLKQVDNTSCQVQIYIENDTNLEVEISYIVISK